MTALCDYPGYGRKTVLTEGGSMELAIPRTLGSAQRRVAPVHGNALLAALPAGTVGVRDRALLLVGFGAALRRSELVGLNLDDVQLFAKGVRVRLRRSKTDQTGAGAVMAIRRGRTAETCAATALDAWLRLRGGTAVPAGGQGRPGAPAAPVGDGRGARGEGGRRPRRPRPSHRLRPLARAGLAAAARAGAPLLAIMTQTRHRLVQVACGFVRDAELWRDNVTDQLL
ncbi:tyrosine-type recombinase/integrase [Azospirillum argentinense]|uniref:tyrosine-type recombinase/integrase n=1 Tax=Azospirillum argentinense TaxID=2970906 RepID=UPI0011F1B54E|nr:tyrosine-type recombinase/integrase [Azospirillum argentinense]